MSSSATGVGMPICFLGAILLILTQKSSQKFGDVLGIMALDLCRLYRGHTAHITHSAQFTKEINNTQLKHLASFTLKISPFPLQTPCTKQLVSVTLFFQCGSFDVWRKLRELRSATLGMESRKANISSFVLRGGSEVMFREPQNSSLHHEGGEFLLPMVAENEYTNCNYCHYMLKFVIYLYNCVNNILFLWQLKKSILSL